MCVCANDMRQRFDSLLQPMLSLLVVLLLLTVSNSHVRKSVTVLQPMQLSLMQVLG
jgi:hypothetical protein